MGILGGEPGIASGLTIARAGTRDWRDAVAGSDHLALPSAQDAVDQHVGLVMASSQGGGGLGDPLERDPQAVLADWNEGLVSTEGALRDYGVVVDGDTIDLQATADARIARRRERLNGREPIARTAARRGERLSTHFSVTDGNVLCTGCGTAICAVDEPIIASLAMFETSAGYRFAPTDLYPGSERFRVRFFYCPGCATQVDVQVVIAGDQSNETTQIAALSK
jgi:N-methylhydantoinase B